MALTIESILPAEQTKSVGETIEITTVATISNYDDKIEYNSSISTYTSPNIINTPSISDVAIVSLPTEDWSVDISSEVSNTNSFYGSSKDWVASELLTIEVGNFKVRAYEKELTAVGFSFNEGDLTLPALPVPSKLVVSTKISRVGSNLNISITTDLTGDEVRTATIPYGQYTILGLGGGASGVPKDTIHTLGNMFGADYTYQYNKDGSPILGATEATYNKTAEAGDSGSYTCTVSDGVDTVTSDTVSVVVASQDTPENYLANNISDYEPTYSQNVSFTLLSSGDIRAVDRGEITDTYTTTLEYIGSGDELVSIVNFLRQNLEFEMPATDVRIFGDHISNTESAFNVSVMDITPLVATSVNTQSFEVTLAIVAPYLYSPVVSVLPSMTCVNPTYERLFVDGYSVASTYGSDYFTNDSERIYRSFKGQYKLTTEATSELLYIWSNVFRGSTIAITDGDFGVVDMFGDGETSHNVIVEDVVVQRDGYEYRDVEIKLIKVG